MNKLLEREAVEVEWEERSRRPGILAVRTARFDQETNEAASVRMKREVFNFLGPFAEVKNVLEIGVGIGEMTSELAQKADFVEGVDISEGMLARARVNLALYPNVRLHKGRITEAQFEVDQFDLVFCSLVLEHVIERAELLDTASKMMELSNSIFLAEPTNPVWTPPTSDFVRVRAIDEYKELFPPYQLTKYQPYSYLTCPLSLMLFQK